MVKRQKVTPGQVLAIPRGDGTSQIAHVWAVTIGGLLLVGVSSVVEQSVGDRPLMLPALLANPSPIFLHLVTPEAIKTGRWPVIGTLEPPSSTQFPVFHEYRSGSHVVTVMMDDGPRRRVSRRSYAMLPPHHFVTSEVLDWAVRAEAGLDAFSPYMSLDDLRPQPGLTEKEWFRPGLLGALISFVGPRRPMSGQR